MELSLLISWFPSPRLFTSSIFLNDSVVDPASEVVSATIIFCIFFIFLPRTELSIPSIGIEEKKIGAIIHETLIAYIVTKITPTRVVNKYS